MVHAYFIKPYSSAVPGTHAVPYLGCTPPSPRHTRGPVPCMGYTPPHTATCSRPTTSRGGNVSKHTVLERVCTLGSVQACRAWHCSAGQVQVSRHAPPS